MIIAAYVPSVTRPVSRRSVSVVVKASSSEDASALSRRAVVGLGLVAYVVAAPMTLPEPSVAGQVVSPEWEVVSTGTGYDIHVNPSPRWRPSISC